MMRHLLHPFLVNGSPLNKERRVHYLLHRQDFKSIPLVKQKRKYSLLEDFDPRPTQYQGTAKDHMPTLLDKICGKNLCLSLLFDKSCQNNNTIHSPADTNIPSIESLKRTVEAFKSSLKVSEEAIRKIENETREQRASSSWYEA